MGMLERGGEVRTKVLSNRKKPAVQAELRKHVQAGSAIFTDELQSYADLTDYQHEVINHAVKYVQGNVHTNGERRERSLVERSSDTSRIEYSFNVSLRISSAMPSRFMPI